MAIRILIVDDEPVFRDALKDGVDWDAMNAVVVGTAFDGADALRILGSNEIDLILTDLRMPNMDGLALIERVHGEQPDTRFIVLSAYDDFPLVRRAFRLGVSDYLIKDDIRLDALPDLLREVCSNARDTGFAPLDDGAPRTKTPVPGDRVHEMDESLVQLVLRKAIDGRISDDVVMQTLRIPEPVAGGRIYVGAGILHLPISAAREHALATELRDRTEAAVECAIADEPSLHGYVQNGRYIFVIAVSKPITSAATDRIFRRVWERVWDTVGRSGVRFTIGYSERFHTIRRIPEQLGEADRAAACYFVKGAGRVFRARTDDKQPRPEEDVRSEIPDPFAFARYLSEGIVPGRESSDFSIHPWNVDPRDHVSVREYFTRCSAYLITYIDRRNVDERTALTVLSARFEDLGRVNGDLRDYNEWLAEVVRSLGSRRRYGHCTVEAAVAYVSDHLAEELTLTRMGELLRCNPSYFSRLFSTTTGTGFADFVQEQRIRRARDLLRRPDLRIRDIAASVGFQNAETFTRTFKRKTGTSPRDYRFRNVKNRRNR